MTTTDKESVRSMPAVTRARNMALRNVAAHVRSRRESMGLTRRDLAAKAGVHEDALQKIEMMQRLPTSETLLLVAVALGCTIGDLFQPHTVKAPS